MMLRLAQQKERGGRTWWTLIAGKGLAEDVTNSAAARPVIGIAGRGGRPREEKESKTGERVY